MTEFTNALIEYGVELEDVKKRFVDDEEFYRECLEMFFMDDSLEKLKNAIDNMDVVGAFNAAHTIKGIVGNLGLTPLFEETSSMVEDFREKNMGNAMTKYKRIVAEYEKVKEISKL